MAVCHGGPRPNEERRPQHGQSLCTGFQAEVLRRAARIAALGNSPGTFVNRVGAWLGFDERVLAATSLLCRANDLAALADSRSQTMASDSPQDQTRHHLG